MNLVGVPKIAQNRGFEIKRWLTSEDVGTVINSMIVGGQIHGAVVEGLSSSMFEEFVYDEQGQQLTADFEHYRLAAAGVPDIETSSGPGALTNAVCDVFIPFDIEIDSSSNSLQFSLSALYLG